MRSGSLIGPTIVAIGLVIAAISFALVGAVMNTADGTTELRVERLEAEIEKLRRDLGDAAAQVQRGQQDTKRILDDLARLASQSATAPAARTSTPLAPGETEERAATEEMTEVMKLAKSRFNVGITQPNNGAMLELLGRPRADLSQDCRGVTEPHLKSLLETRRIGPIEVTMIRPALDSLARIMAKLQATEPDIYAQVGTAGALCARLIRGSSSSISNHSWGTAIDLKLENRLDGFADGGTQFGLLILAELFNEEGWFWGATYNREDSMHFEVGVETLRSWAAAGQI